MPDSVAAEIDDIVSAIERLATGGQEVGTEDLARITNAFDTLKGTNANTGASDSDMVIEEATPNRSG